MTTTYDSSRNPLSDISNQRPVSKLHLPALLKTIVLHGVLLTAVFIVMIPVIWLLLSSIKSNGEFNAYPIQFLPRTALWSNYANAWDKLEFLSHAWRTLQLALIFSTLNVCSSALVGFGFARFDAPGRKFLFTLMLSTMMVPGIITIIPQFILYSRFGLVGTYWPWVLWGLAGNPFQIFLFRQFFATFPKDLEDAAEVDGCTPLRTFLQIFMPNSGAVVATTAIFSFQWVWGDFFYQSIFLGGGQTTLAVRLATAFSDARGLPNHTLTMAGIVMYVFPLVVLYFFAQRYIIRGIVTTGLK